MKCLPPSAPSTGQCLSDQGMLKAPICQLQTACYASGDPWACKHPPLQSREGGSGVPTVRPEERQRETILYSCLPFLHSYSQTGTQTPPELQALLHCMEGAVRVPGLWLR